MFLWIGKNYRLHDIQLSKNIRGNITPRKLSETSGRFPRNPLASLASGAPKPHAARSPTTPHAVTRGDPFRPTPFPRAAPLVRLTCLAELTDGAPRLHAARSPTTVWTREPIVPTGPYLVENTGLEPVTSWLQTRRSPS